MVLAAVARESRGVRAVARAIDALGREEFAHSSAGELGDDLVAIRRSIDCLEAVHARRLRRFDELGGPAQDGALNATAWVRANCRLSGAAAAERVEVARQLPKLEESSVAFRSGQLSYPHAAVLARTVSEVGVDAVKAAETSLLATATQVDPGRFRFVSQHLRYVLEPDAGLDAANALHARRFFNVAQAPHGGFGVDGLLDREDGAKLLAALRALDGPPRKDDTRTPAQRRSDALMELVTRQLRSGLPSSHGQRPHLVVTVLAPPENGRPGPGEIQGAGPIPRETVERLACDASFTTIRVDGTGQPLDLGRESRYPNAAIRTALIHRDQGCRFPGCNYPPEWTDAHHVDEWSRDGKTRMRRMVLLCRQHHRQVHELRWSMRLFDDGQVEVRRPDGSLLVLRE